MSRNKAQLDVYCIDSLAVLNELKESVNDSTHQRIIEKLSNHMIKFEDLSEEDISYFSKMIIEFIINQQNNKKKGLKYEQIALDHAEHKSYKLVLYEAYSKPISAVKTLVRPYYRSYTGKFQCVEYSFSF